MTTPKYTVTCTKNECIAHDIHEIVFTKPEGFTFKAGQFVLWNVPLVEDPSDIETRAYSIASAPHEEELIFVVKILPEGRAGRWISEILREGTAIKIQGPIGIFTIDPEKDGDYVMVCTSVGYAPFRSHILDALHRGETRKFDVFLGAFAEEDLFWREECEALCKHDNVDIHFALDKAEKSWSGHHGRVQTLIPKIFPDLSGKNIYICGNPMMAKDVKMLCMEEWGVPKERIHVEGF